MLVLIETQIDGIERKKKLTLSDGVDATRLRDAIIAAFSGEASVSSNKIKTLEIYDEDFGEWIDYDGNPVNKDKCKFRVRFEGSVSDDARLAERDRMIQVLKERLAQIETSMKVVASRATSADTLSQRSASSDLRKQKREEKVGVPYHCDDVSVIGSEAADGSSMLRKRESTKEERKKQRAQDFHAEMIV